MRKKEISMIILAGGASKNNHRSFFLSHYQFSFLTSIDFFFIFIIRSQTDMSA